MIATLLTGGNLQVTGGISGSTVTAVANVTGGNINTGGMVTATGNVRGGNITTPGQMSATGNITTTSFFVGNFGFDQIGKPLGIDIKEKKMTLPLIYALQQSNRSEKRRIINIIKNKSDEPNQVQMVLDFVRQSGGLAYTETQMKRYQQEAFDLIANLGSDTHRKHLENLVLYTTQRTN